MHRRSRAGRVPACKRSAALPATGCHAQPQTPDASATWPRFSRMQRMSRTPLRLTGPRSSPSAPLSPRSWRQPSGHSRRPQARGSRHHRLLVSDRPENFHAAGALTRWSPSWKWPVANWAIVRRRSLAQALTVDGQRRGLPKDAAGAGLPAVPLRTLPMCPPRPAVTYIFPRNHPPAVLGGRHRRDRRATASSAYCCKAVPLAESVGRVDLNGELRGLLFRRRCTPSSASRGRTPASKPAPKSSCIPSATGPRSEVAVCASPGAHSFMGCAQTSQCARTSRVCTPATPFSDWWSSCELSRRSVIVAD